MPRFVKGQARGPGRPSGCRNKSTVMLDALGGESIEETVRMVQKKANEGNLHAAALLLARMWPRGPRPLLLGLPTVKTAADVAKANTVLIERISEGVIAPEQASAVSNILDNHRKAIDTQELEKRIRDLEATTAHLPDPLKRSA
jgi:hypothetical protein